MSPGKLTTGTVLVVSGVLLLLNNLGVIGWDVWWNLASLWPVLLISSGIGLVFRGTRLALLGPLIILVALGYAVATPGRPLHPWVQWSFGERATEAREVVFSRSPRAGIESLAMSIDFGAGELRVNGGSENLYDATLEYRGASQPRESFSTSGSVARARLYQRGGGVVGPQSWNLQLASEQKVDLDVDAGACKAVLDLSLVRLAGLTVDCGASSVDVTLGRPQGAVVVHMSSGASSVKLRFPRGVDLSIRMDSALTSSNVGSLGLEREGRTWRTRGFGSRGDSYELKLSSGVGSVDFGYDDSQAAPPDSDSRGV